MNEGESQEPVFAMLADPATHGGAPVKRIDTHAASVFLAGTRTFKVKRAVRFPFLDYSTLDLRKKACEAELEVNRPYAPEIYRGVVPITREADGRLALDGAGAPVEWAVEMRRFDEDATLDRLAEAGRIDAGLADALGRAVAAAHATATEVDARPWVKALADYIEEHVAAFGEMPDLFPAEDVDALARASRAAYARIHPLLVERASRGLVRRIHGDLHLGNIVLLEGRPVLFDAIEFSPLIASGDVLYDLAFLLMDLTARGLRPAANLVLNRYLYATGTTRRLRRSCNATVLLVDARGHSRQGDGSAAAIGEQREKGRDRERCAPILRPCVPADRPAASPLDRRRRAFRHRQIGARARAGARPRSSARRGGVALGCGAQDAVRQGRT